MGDSSIVSLMVVSISLILGDIAKYEQLYIHYIYNTNGGSTVGYYAYEEDYS